MAAKKNNSDGLSSQLTGEQMMERMLDSDCDSFHCIAKPTTDDPEVRDDMMIYAHVPPFTAELTPDKPDMVNSPDHYVQGNVEVIDAMVDQFDFATVKTHCVLNAFKYVCRFQKKGGDEDLKKAIWYLRFAVGDDPRKRQ